MHPTPIELAVLVLVPLGALSTLSIAAFVDAKRRGAGDPATWAGIVVLTGGVGALAYLLERSAGANDDEYHGPRTLPGGSAGGRTNRDDEAEGN